MAHDEEFIASLYARYGLRIVAPMRYGWWAGHADSLSYQDIVVGERDLEHPPALTAGSHEAVIRRALACLPRAAHLPGEQQSDYSTLQAELPSSRDRDRIVERSRVSAPSDGHGNPGRDRGAAHRLAIRN